MEGLKKKKKKQRWADNIPFPLAIKPALHTRSRERNILNHK